MKDEAMTSAVDGLKQRFMDMSQPDDDGVYRNGATKRKARTELAMQLSLIHISEPTRH